MIDGDYTVQVYCKTIVGLLQFACYFRTIKNVVDTAEFEDPQNLLFHLINLSRQVISRYWHKFQFY